MNERVLLLNSRESRKGCERRTLKSTGEVEVDKGATPRCGPSCSSPHLVQVRLVSPLDVARPRGMDIDAGPSAHAFGLSYPLPFRVLFLSFSTLFGFATNLHLLSHLGIDTAHVLDIRLDDYRNLGSSSLLPRAPAPFVHPSRLYPPLYALSALGIAWTTFGWMVFAQITGGDPEQMSNWRAVPAFVALVVGAAAVAPWNALYRRERMMFLG